VAASLQTLYVVIHRKLERMRTQPERRYLVLALVPDPSLDHRRREHVAFEQKFVVVFQCRQSFVKTARQRRNIFQFLRRKIVNILIERFFGEAENIGIRTAAERFRAE